MVFSIGCDASLRITQLWAANYNLSYPVLGDPDSSVTAMFLPDYGGVFLFPHSCIIDDEQILQWTHYGYEPIITIEVIDSILQSLMTPELSASLNSVDFDTVIPGQSAEVEIYLDNSRTGILNVTSATVNGTPYSVNFTPGEIYALDDSMLITVSFTPPQNLLYNDTLVIESDGGTLYIPLTGVGLETGIGELDDKHAEHFILYGNYPNPFNVTTQFRFNLPFQTGVRLEVFALDGSLLSTLDLGEMDRGAQTINFTTKEFASGIYYYRLTAGKYSALGKMLLLK
jgi:hypothetical protein